MRRPLMLLMMVLASVLISGCGTSGSSASPPAAGLVLVPGDGIITASWVMEPGVEYWMFFAPSPSISTTNWTTIVGSRSIINVASPFVATSLGNGLVYSFTVNGRKDGGPGGEGTPSVSAIPRLAGTATALNTAPWTAGTALGANDLRGLTWSTQFVAVGASGVIYTSADGVIWTAITPPVSSNLNAALYTGAYLAAGDGGVMLYSLDAKTWVPRVSGTTSNLYGMGQGAGRTVAVGAGGTIITSIDGISWTVAASSGTVTTNDLYAVTAFGANLWLAVGARGTLLSSADANTWTALNSNTVLDLKAITSGTSTATAAAVFVAVGASGALVTSPDAVTWTAQPAIGSGASTLSAVKYGTQFIAVGTGGGIFTSTDAKTWAGQPSTTGADLNAIAHASFSYSVVGAAGVNLLGK
jgi:hypothetical protein